jgi:hypothetical protein
MPEDDDADDAAWVAAVAAEAATVPPVEAEAPTLERMQALAEEVNDIDERIAKNEARIKELQDRRYAILGTELVDLMDRAHVPMLQVGKRKFTAAPYYKAVIPTENPGPGLDWLEANDAGDLIKNEVVAAFPRGAEDEAKLAADLLRKRFQMAAVERRRTVHWATLTSWLKEVHQSGDTLPPLDLIGGTIGRTVKITNTKGE